MERLMPTRPEFFSFARQLKASLDPNGIIAPGRYCPQKVASAQSTFELLRRSRERSPPVSADGCTEYL